MVFHPVTELVEYLDSGVWFETGMDFSSVWNVEFELCFTSDLRFRVLTNLRVVAQAVYDRPIQNEIGGR